MVAELVGWYADHARDLPWRAAGVTPWGVLVSEVMLQQTPAARVVGPWQEWMDRWPRPADLAAADQAAVIRGWGRLGYPRRALRLRQAADRICTVFGGEVPDDPALLRDLPGIGEYTAAAVATFGFGRRELVLDTNVRRVIARLDAAQALPGAAITSSERERARRWLPEDAPAAARWSVAAMEFGALICTATAPDCSGCPVRSRCRWFAAGSPAPLQRRPSQPWQGTDRQCRGVLLEVLRQSPTIVAPDRLLSAWPSPEQAGRCLASLLADGLVLAEEQGYRL